LKLERLNLRPRYRNPVLVPKAADIRHFEKHFGIVLPTAFIEFLKHCNGGTSNGRIRLKAGRDVYGINDFYGLGPATEARDDYNKGWDYGNLWDETHVLRPIIGEKCIPFARDGGGNKFFLDCNSTPAAVGYWNASTRNQKCLFKDFESFLNVVYLKSDDDE